jgi:hypothetical protein
MIINRSHLPWAFLIAAATLVICAIYLEIFRPGSIPRYIPVPDSLGTFPFGHRSVGATPLGIAYGTAAFLIFIFAALLGGRKKVRHWRIGRAESWMRAHIWLSILTVPLVALHCGLRSGPLITTGLLVLYAIVMISGFYGLALQQFLPTQMMDRLTHEVIYDQIPFLRKKLIEAAIELQEELAPSQPISGGSRRMPPLSASGPASVIALAVENPMAGEGRAALREVLEDEVLPYLRAAGRSRSRLGRRESMDNLFRVLRISVPEEFRAKVDKMQRWCEESRQMELQTVLQHWLHYWLFVHVPASILLLIWTAWHAVTGLFYY